MQEPFSRVMQLSSVWPPLQVAVPVHWLVEVPPLVPPVLLPKPPPPLLPPEPPIMMVEVQACWHPVAMHCADDVTQESHAGERADWHPWRQLASPGLQAQ